MKHALFLFLCLSWLSTVVAQNKYTISGYVEDASTGEALIGANVYDQQTLLGTATNAYGFFSLTLPEGPVTFTISFVGYPTYVDSFYLDKDIQLTLPLASSFDLDAVEIKATKVNRIEELTQMSTVSIPIEQIKQLPAFMGEVDVLKALQLMPGVQSGNEGTSGLFVRGGSPDQNLVLLDGVPVYNVSHLFGFFSVFNADALNSVQLIKGGFPARYGGRLSSVLEINMKEGNKKEWHGEGSVGIIASKLTVEGPLIKDKASILISGRRTYIDLLAQPIIRAGFASGGGSGSAGYYFYDLNGKVNYKISDRDRLYFSGYFGDDRFYFRERYRYNEPGYSSEERFGGELTWGNATSVLRWNHQFNKKLFSNVTAYYSRYQFNTGVEDGFKETQNGVTTEEFFGLRYFSGIDDWSGKIDFDWVPNANHYIRFGGSGIYHTFRPGATQFEADFGVGNALDTTIAGNNTRAGEYRIYLEDDIKVNQRFKMNIGLHGSAFAVDNQWYYDIEPRLSMRYLLTDNLSAKASYARMSQYIHLLTNSGVGLPTDLWVPATGNVPPQRSWQVAAGLAQTVADQFEVSLEGYYKIMNNVIEYRDGASYLGNANDWESQVVSGQGLSYGAELFVQKKTGKTTGWLGYTLSWTNRLFEELNFGEPFPYKYDRRHDLSIAIVHEIDNHWTLSGTWVYGTGNAISLPLAQYSGINVGYNDFFNPFNQLLYYESRNGFRMRAYHRMDLGITHKKATRWGERSWNLSVYNAYSRLNPFFIYYGSDDFGNPAFRQVSLFPILPSLSYAFSF